MLQRWSEGDREALEQLTPLVYAELRRMARRYMNQQPAGHTLQTTALIHEAYLRLVGQEGKQWENRDHFFGVAAQAMRHILVDYARARKMNCGMRNAECGMRKWKDTPLTPLALLGLARTASLAGDEIRSRKARQDFLTVWQNADPDLPILRAAKEARSKKL